MEKTRNGFQPVFTLPVEILCRIFAECTDEDDGMSADLKRAVNVSKYTSFDPFTLGRVCSLWRSAANGFPYLWSKIYVCNPRRGHIDTIKTWLRRSQEHKLSIHLRAEGDESDVPTLLEAVRILACYSERWCDVVLEVPEEMLYALNMVFLEAAPPINLKTAKVSTYKCHKPVAIRIPHPENDSDGYSGWYSDVWSYFYSSSSLRSVIWHDPAAARKNVPFHQITNLVIVLNNATMDIVDILFKCTNLEHLSLSISESLGVLPPSPLQVILPSLHDIFIMSDVSVRPLLSRMTAPSLKTLQLGFHVWEMVLDGPETVLDFLNRSKCRLSTFEIGDRCQTDELLRQYLSIPRLSTVTKLCIFGPVCTPTLELLAGQTTENSFSIMPELKHLLVDCGEVMDGTIEELVRSRWPNVWDGSADRKQGYFKFKRNHGGIGPTDEAFLIRMRKEYLRKYYGISFEL